MKALMTGVLALLANAGLLFLVSRAQSGTATAPVKETWTVREVFQPAPPPRSGAPADDTAQAEPDRPVPPSDLAPATSMETQSPQDFAPRTSLPSFDIGQTGVGGGPAVPLPFGLPGGELRSSSAPAPVPAALSLQQVDRPPQPSLTPLPPYPQWARAARLTASVTLRFVVKADGRVENVSIESVEGDVRFGPIAVEAVQDWRFDPASVDGKSVAVRVSQRLRFRLVE